MGNKGTKVDENLFDNMALKFILIKIKKLLNNELYKNL